MSNKKLNGNKNGKKKPPVGGGDLKGDSYQAKLVVRNGVAPVASVTSDAEVVISARSANSEPAYAAVPS